MPERNTVSIYGILQPFIPYPAKLKFCVWWKLRVLNFSRSVTFFAKRKIVLMKRDNRGSFTFGSKESRHSIKVDVRKWRDGRFSDSSPLFSFLVTLTSIRIVSILPIFAISLPRILTLSLPPRRLLFRYLLRRRISRLISLGDRVV